MMPTTSRLLLTKSQLAQQLGVGIRTLERMDAAGLLGPEKQRFSKTLVRWRAAEVEAWIAASCPARARWKWRRS